MKGKTKAQKSVACQKSRECGQYGTWQPCVFLPDSKTVPGLGGWRSSLPSFFKNYSSSPQDPSVRDIPTWSLRWGQGLAYQGPDPF